MLKLNGHCELVNFKEVVRTDASLNEEIIFSYLLTDGSEIDSGVGIYSMNPPLELSFSLGNLTTV